MTRRGPAASRDRESGQDPPAGCGGHASSRDEGPADSGTAAAVARLDEITRRLRRECPWDREQDERSIVPHTVEEAYELADAAHSGDDAKLLDELGDVLFQVMFLALLLEERGKGDLAEVAEACRQKLVRRHPHVFAATEAADAAAVLRNWDQIKRAEAPAGGPFGDLPQALPATLYARKVQRRAAGAGAAQPQPDALAERIGDAATALLALTAAEGSSDERFETAGELLFAAVALSRAAGADPELALRAAADRFRTPLEETEASRAGEADRADASRPAPGEGR